MNRNDVTEMIVAAKIQKGIKWADVAEKIGLSKEWVTAGCLGQMTFNATQAGLLGEIFALPSEAVALLQSVPYKGSLPTAIPADTALKLWIPWNTDCSAGVMTVTAKNPYTTVGIPASTSSTGLSTVRTRAGAYSLR